MSAHTDAQPVRIGQRAAHFQESVIREMTRLAEDVGALNLSQGLPDMPTPAAVSAAAAAAITAGENQYTYPFGVTPFRQAVARKTAAYNQIACDPDENVTITCGVSEAMASVIFALTEPGDEAIIFQPWYENYVPDCLMAGVRPVFVPLHEPDYSFDPAELRAAFTNRTRLVLFNSPHNPTGRVFTRAELSEIARLCQEFGVIAVTDEIYEYILYAGHTHISLGSLPGMEDRCVTLSGLGKTFAVTGWRVGWAVAHADLTAQIRKVHDYLTICAPGPFQYGGIAALALDEQYYQRMRAEYAHQRSRLLEALSAGGFTYTAPQGAYYVMADFAAIDWPRSRYTRPEWKLDRAFAEYLIREIGVAGVPGSSFYTGSGGETRIRFNFAKHDSVMAAAAERLRAARA